MDNCIISSSQKKIRRFFLEMQITLEFARFQMWLHLLAQNPSELAANELTELI
jgi:hypothetical protein